jgi:predicted helicase
MVEQTKLGIQYQDIAASRESANKVKREEPVMVVIGNPPHDKAPKGSGKWIETGEGGPSAKAPLDAFRAPSNGRYEYVLANLHVYFWRWGTWKVFDHHPNARCGVVALISPSAFLTSPGFAGMRAYLRRTADEGWIVDLSPEGHQPDTATRVFPSVQQPLCIAIFARHKVPHEGSPAKIHYLAVSGRAEEKRARLRRLMLADPDWSVCSENWQAPLSPKQDMAWTRSPLVSDLLPWSSRGVTPGRTWVYAPDEETLEERWDQFLAADPEERRELLGESCDRRLDSRVDPLPGVAPHRGTLAEEAGPNLQPVPIGYRSFDRQWLIPDNRLMVRPRPDLWRVRSDQQVYTCEHPQPPTSGPALTFSAYIPDLDFYKGNGGGRIYPLYRDAEALTPNMSPKLLPFLTARLGLHVTAEDVLAYIASMVAHPTYTQRFREELHLPGVRVPLTADSALWSESVTLGREVLWLHTYGERYVDSTADLPRESPKLPEDRSPKVVAEIPDVEDEMPNDISYEPQTSTLHIGKGRIAPVLAQVWNYEVSGTRIIPKWFGYRKRKPAGKRSSRLDDINPPWWPRHRTTDLLNLLKVLARLVKLETEQAKLLEQILTCPQITITDLESVGVLPVSEGLRKLPRSYGSPTLFD